MFPKGQKGKGKGKERQAKGQKGSYKDSKNSFNSWDNNGKSSNKGGNQWTQSGDASSEWPDAQQIGEAENAETIRKGVFRLKNKDCMISRFVRPYPQPDGT
eukprot:5878507-Karenia_brevis.AAC.1